MRRKQKEAAEQGAAASFDCGCLRLTQGQPEDCARCVKDYGRRSGVMAILPLFPKPVSGFTALSFDPFFTGVFFIYFSPSNLNCRLGLCLLIVHTRAKPRGTFTEGLNCLVLPFSLDRGADVRSRFGESALKNPPGDCFFSGGRSKFIGSATISWTPDK